MLVYEKSGPKGQIEWHRGYEIRLKDQILNRYLILGIFLYLKDLPTAAPYRCMAAKIHALYKISTPRHLRSTPPTTTEPHDRIGKTRNAVTNHLN